MPDSGVFPATPGEWAMAALRYLVNARMLRAALTPDTLLRLHAGVDEAARLVRLHDADRAVEPTELAEIYAVLVELERIFTAAGMTRAAEGAGSLCARYQALVPVGGGLLPHSPLGESRL